MTGVAIFIGGGLGATLRWLLSRSTAVWFVNFPVGVLICNLLGCFLIGLCAGLWPRPTTWQMGITTGILGGFTTFSTFSLDTLKLMQRGDLSLALLNSIGSLLGGLALAWLGYALTSQTR